ncbi:hypothetical protein [Nonomuraea longicatena]|uniref:Uncharacterized protein n=1 Tax=Nonomuraea longicatena TaxID=83682 RepID=A0ABP3Z976_9ACTN
MRLREIAGTCEGGTCPAVYDIDADPDHCGVRGHVVSDPDAPVHLGLPEGETAVIVPRALLRKAIDADIPYEMAWGYHLNQAVGEHIVVVDVAGSENQLAGVPDF